MPPKGKSKAAAAKKEAAQPPKKAPKAAVAKKTAPKKAAPKKAPAKKAAPKRSAAKKAAPKPSKSRKRAPSTSSSSDSGEDESSTSGVSAASDWKTSSDVDESPPKARSPTNETQKPEDTQAPPPRPSKSVSAARDPAPSAPPNKNVEEIPTIEITGEDSVPFAIEQPSRTVTQKKAAARKQSGSKDSRSPQQASTFAEPDAVASNSIDKELQRGLNPDSTNSSASNRIRKAAATTPDESAASLWIAVENDPTPREGVVPLGQAALPQQQQRSEIPSPHLSVSRLHAATDADIAVTQPLPTPAVQSPQAGAREISHRPKKTDASAWKGAPRTVYDVDIEPGTTEDLQAESTNALQTAMTQQLMPSPPSAGGRLSVPLGAAIDAGNVALQRAMNSASPARRRTMSPLRGPKVAPIVISDDDMEELPPSVEKTPEGGKKQPPTPQLQPSEPVQSTPMSMVDMTMPRMPRPAQDEQKSPFPVPEARPVPPAAPLIDTTKSPANPDELREKRTRMEAPALGAPTTRQSSRAAAVIAGSTSLGELPPDSANAFSHTVSFADQRPVDIALKRLFPQKFTKKGYVAAAEHTVTPEHMLGQGEFWDAFASIDYINEGSFGFVWQCRTIDDDKVAVKSCPISFGCPESIDDAYSLLREVAVLRFLNEHQVPYILPLHAAFFVNDCEALPPLQRAEWKKRQELKERQLVRESAAKKEAKKVAQKMKRAGSTEPPPSWEEFMPKNIDELDSDVVFDTTVSMPKFFALSDEEATEADATLFIVTDLCDGDVDSIEKTESVAKGVSFCVSSALSDMHRLGIVHLDIKPPNVLYRVQHELVNGALQPRVKYYLGDMGNCQIVGPSYTDPVDGEAIGTYEYMDTTALQHKRCDRRTDCFSLGCMIYELLIGRRFYVKPRVFEAFVGLSDSDREMIEEERRIAAEEASNDGDDSKDIEDPDASPHGFNPKLYIPQSKRHVELPPPHWIFAKTADAHGAVPSYAKKLDPSTSTIARVMKALMSVDPDTRMTAAGCRHQLLPSSALNATPNKAGAVGVEIAKEVGLPTLPVVKNKNSSQRDKRSKTPQPVAGASPDNRLPPPVMGIDAFTPGSQSAISSSTTAQPSYYRIL